MIIVQTPLRVSLFGGGTDFPSYIKEEGGCVLSMAIDKFIFVTLKRRFDDKLRIGYTRTEMVDSVDEVEHELIREALRKTGIVSGVEVTTMGDIPSAGSGLGSSSTVTVGSLHAMYAYLGEIVPAERLAKEACEIELDVLKKPIGIQDQYIAAYGGLRFFEFLPDGMVQSEKIILSSDSLRKMNENFLLFYTGITRKAETILAEQSKRLPASFETLRKLKNTAKTAVTELRAGNIDVLGEMLHESWILKKKLANTITNGQIDMMYADALRNGASGGKITGAGGGGFLLLYCPHEKQPAVRKALTGLQELPFNVESYGSKVIFDYNH